MNAKLLKRILQLTKENKIAWQPKEPNTYRAERDGLWIEITFPETTDSLPDYAVLRMEGLDFRFYQGTDGMEMIRKILRRAAPEWQERQDAIKQNLISHIEMLDRIRQ